MTPNQKLFNDAFLGLKAQGFVRSYDDRCLYRGPNGTKCAIGHCLSDDLYNPDFEGSGVWHQQGITSALQSRYGDLGYSFLIDLQNAHDEGHTPEEMEKGLCKVAEEYSLKVPA